MKPVAPSQARVQCIVWKEFVVVGNASRQTMVHWLSRAQFTLLDHPAVAPGWLLQRQYPRHQAKTKEELERLTQIRLTTMSQAPELLQGIFFCWIADLSAQAAPCYNY